MAKSKTKRTTQEPDQQIHKKITTETILTDLVRAKTLCERLNQITPKNVSIPNIDSDAKISDAQACREDPKFKAMQDDLAQVLFGSTRQRYPRKVETGVTYQAASPNSITGMITSLQAIKGSKAASDQACEQATALLKEIQDKRAAYLKGMRDLMTAQKKTFYLKRSLGSSTPK